MEHYIYVVFSATPYKMGKMIRKVTRQPYNHVSISLDDRLQKMYSFARYYRDTPFYGGFVKETHMRYSYNNAGSSIRIYRIPVSKQEYVQVQSYIKCLVHNRNQYLYNTFSAVCTPMRFRIRIDKSYTCTEFAVNVLSQVNEDIHSNRFYSIMELQDKLKKYLVYQGRMEDVMNACERKEDEFLEKHGVFSRSYFTVSLLSKLVARMCKRSY